MDEDQYLEDSLEEVSFVPKDLSAYRSINHPMNGRNSYSSSGHETREDSSTHRPPDNDSDDDSLEDSITAARLRQRQAHTSMSSLAAPSSIPKRPIAKNFHIMLAGQDEAVLIQKVFRGYRGRKLAAKQQLLQERYRIRSREMQRKRHVNPNQPKPTSKPSSAQEDTSSVLIQRALRLSIDKGVVNPAPQQYSQLPSYQAEDPAVYIPTKISPKLVQEAYVVSKKKAYPVESSSKNEDDEYDELNDSLEQPSQRVSSNKQPAVIESRPSPVRPKAESSSSKMPPAPSSSSGAYQHRLPPTIRDLIPASAIRQPQQTASANHHIQPSPIRPHEQHLASDPSYLSNQATQQQQGKPRQRSTIIQAQAKRAQAATLLQRMYRGHAARKLAQKRREQLIQIDRYECPNCHRIEQSGSYCKGCGRPRNKIISKAKPNRPMLTTVIEEPTTYAAAGHHRPKDLRDRITPTTAKPKEAVRYQPQSTPQTQHQQQPQRILPQQPLPHHHQQPQQQQVMRAQALDSMIDLQTEERRLLLELAAIDRLQQQKLHDLQQALRHAPAAQTKPSSVPKHAQASSSKQQQPNVSQAQAKDATPVTSTKVASGKATAKDDPSIKIVKKEKVAFTAAAKDYKPAGMKLEARAPVQASHAPSTKVIPQAAQAIPQQQQHQPQPQPSIVSLSIASKPKDQQPSGYQYSNPGYLGEYRKKSRASSAGRSRNTLAAATEKAYDSRSDGQIPVNRPSYGYGDASVNSSVYETVSLPAIQSTAHGLHVSKSAPPGIGISAQVAPGQDALKHKLIDHEVTRFPAIHQQQLKNKYR
jgi:hypothetical protein